MKTLLSFGTKTLVAFFGPVAGASTSIEQNLTFFTSTALLVRGVVRAVHD